MPLQIRRGSSVERLAITPLDGELIWDQTTKRLYVGDGATAGGNTATGYNDQDAVQAIGAALDAGTHSGITFAYDNTSISATLSNVDAEVLSGNANISILSDDGSTLLVNSATGAIQGTSANFGSIEGNLTGSVFADDSTIVVDVENLQINAAYGYFNEVTTFNVGNSNIGLLSNGGLFLNVLETSLITGIVIQSELGPAASGDVFRISTYHEEIEPNELSFLRTRGTGESQTVVTAGDGIFNLSFFGKAINDISPVASISVTADSNGTIGSTVVPGKIEFKTTNDSGTSVTNLSIDKDGIIGFADNTLVAGVASGEVDISSVATYLKINVGGTDYAIPLYAINP